MPAVRERSVVDVDAPISSSSLAFLDGIVSGAGAPDVGNQIDASKLIAHQRKLADIPRSASAASSSIIIDRTRPPRPIQQPAEPLEACVPLPIEFHDICYDVKVLKKGSTKSNPCTRMLQGMGLASAGATETLRVLHNVSGVVPAGRLCALMGASGAGKSTLLNMLSGRANPTIGAVTFAGVSPPAGSLRLVSAFVQQLDMFLGNLSTQEHLITQLMMRLPKEVSKAERSSVLERLLVRMNLVKCRESQISGLHGVGGISGGEKKRLNVAAEVCTTPSILFADEPTTGLDSHMALSIVSVLRYLADNGRTVIATIHQPSSKIFDLFAHLVLLGDGRLLYCGPRDGCVAWFASLGHKCPASTNPADFIVKIAAMPEGTAQRAAKVETLKSWAAKWTSEGEAFLRQWEREGRANFRAEIEKKWEKETIVALGENRSSFLRDVNSAKDSFASSFMLAEHKRGEWNLDGNDDDDDAKETAHKDAVRSLFATRQMKAAAERPSWFKQVLILYKRAMMANKRDKLLFHARAFQTLIVGLLYTTLSWRLGWDSQAARSRSGVAYAALLNQSMTGAMGVVNTFGTERPVIQREYEAGILSPSAYIIAKMLADAPVQIVFPFIFVTMVHWGTAARDDFVKYLVHAGIVLLVANAAMSFGYLASCIAPSPDVAPIIVNLTTLPLTQMGGYFVKISDVPVFLRWIQWISFVYYGFMVSLSNLFGGEKWVTMPDGSSVKGIDYVKSQYEAKPDRVGLYVGILFVILIFLRTATCICFSWVLRRKKENQ